jgi:hypothetical protein
VAGLRSLWRHQVRPLLEEFAGQHPGRVELPGLDELLEPDRPRRRPTASTRSQE